MFDIEVTGYNEAMNKLENLGQSITYDGMSKHCSDIKQEAEKICGLKDPDFKLYITKEGSDTLHINGSLTDRSKIQCIKKAFEKVLPTIPDGIRQLFEAFLKQIEGE